MELSHPRMCSTEIRACLCMHDFQMVFAETLQLSETEPPMLLM